MGTQLIERLINQVCHVEGVHPQFALGNSIEIFGGEADVISRAENKSGGSSLGAVDFLFKSLPETRGPNVLSEDSLAPRNNH